MPRHCRFETRFVSSQILTCPQTVPRSRCRFDVVRAAAVTGLRSAIGMVTCCRQARPLPLTHTGTVSPHSFYQAVRCHDIPMSDAIRGTRGRADSGPDAGVLRPWLRVKLITLGPVVTYDKFACAEPHLPGVGDRMAVVMISASSVILSVAVFGGWRLCSPASNRLISRSRRTTGIDPLYWTAVGVNGPTSRGANMTRRSAPFMSVVIPVYNGSVTIGRALTSLLAQDYPSDRYEIIVINDGSSDDTAQVVAMFPDVRYVELPQNMGIPAAQNAGLAAAKGEIYVAFNDDFQAASDFLRQLARGYVELDKPMGLGGMVVKDASSKTRGLIANFMEANRIGGAPSALDIGPVFLPAVVKRLLAYVLANFMAGQYGEHEDRNHQEVVELYGANASFPISMLRKIGGWDTSTAAPAIGGIEDRDICLRMRHQFPNYHFYVLRSAHIMLELDRHDVSISIKSYLLRPYRRGPFNYAFHAKNGLTPPIFPFPPLIVLTLVADAIWAPVLLPMLIALVPQLCYGWWAYRAVVERRATYVIFPYLQAAEETMVMAGFLKGFCQAYKKSLRRISTTMRTSR